MPRQKRPKAIRTNIDRNDTYGFATSQVAGSRAALGAVCLLGATSAELLRVKRHKFPDAHRRPAGHPLDAVRPPVITTRPMQLAHRQKMPRQMLWQTLPFQLLFPLLGADV